MSRINWPGIASMIVIVVGVLWAATVVCLLWEINQSLEYIAQGSDYLAEMMDMIYSEMTWNISGEYMIPLSEQPATE
jgi:hypothetical protein